MDTLNYATHYEALSHGVDLSTHAPSSCVSNKAKATGIFCGRVACDILGGAVGALLGGIGGGCLAKKIATQYFNSLTNEGILAAIHLLVPGLVIGTVLLTGSASIGAASGALLTDKAFTRILKKAHVL